MDKRILASFTVLVLLIIGSLLVVKSRRPAGNPRPTPTEVPAVQLPVEQQPKLSLSFRPDGRYVTVNITNLHAQALEYNIIYDAMVKKNRLNTGVNAMEKLDGKTEYSKEQLLGSESSGKFTYHENIQNARLELTLRDSAGRSVFTAVYPFEVAPGKTIDLTPAG